MSNAADIPDWVLQEAAKRIGWAAHQQPLCYRASYRTVPAYRAVCDLIHKYEEQPVDRKLACAQEAARRAHFSTDLDAVAAAAAVRAGVTAIELWDTEFGK